MSKYSDIYGGDVMNIYVKQAIAVSIDSNCVEMLGPRNGDEDEEEKNNVRTDGAGVNGPKFHLTVSYSENVQIGDGNQLIPILASDDGETAERDLGLFVSDEDEIKALEYFGFDTAHMLESSHQEPVGKRTHWPTLKQVEVYFYDYKRNFQSYSVNKENLRKGKDMLDKFEELYWGEASPAVKVYFFLYRADYFGRIGQLQRGLDILEKEGSPMAERVGHNHLIKMIEEKRKVFQMLLRTEKGEDTGTLSESISEDDFAVDAD